MSEFWKEIQPTRFQSPRQTLDELEKCFVNQTNLTSSKIAEKNKVIEQKKGISSCFNK